MSIPWLNAAMDDTRSKNGARLMLFVLADRSDDDGVSFYGVETLMEKTNLGLSAAHTALRELVKLGLLRVEYKKGPRGCNIYHLLLTLRNPHCAESAQCGIQQGTLRNPHKDPAESGPNPSLIHQDPIMGEIACSPVSPKAQKKAEFALPILETIYREYPRREHKPEALKAIGKALARLSADKTISDPVAWLLVKVKAYAPTRIGEEAKFTPLPATWFNKERYHDDFARSSNGHSQPSPKPIGSMSAMIASLKTHAS